MSELIDRWMNNSTVKRFKDEEGNIYGIRVIGRGENLFFQENEKALICDIDAPASLVYSASIKNWESNKKMSKKEKGRVLTLIKCYYKKCINENVTIK